MEKQLLFVLGGARSGKSTFAQKFIEAQNCPALFVATAEARDDEMKARIAAHRASRSTNWLTLESPLNVAESIQNTAPTPWLMLDCLTLLVSNILLSCPEPTQETEFRQKLETEMENLLKTYHSYPGSWVIVSNEVGLGLVPPYALGRLYRDGLGWANQRVAQEADKVIFMVAGLPLIVKPSSASFSPYPF
jgi:adenosylcobinamide kinase/adenosylcobinamide-phosphate guanylyltransferase